MSDTETVEVAEAKPARQPKKTPKPCTSSLYSWIDAEGVTHTCGTEGRTTTATFCPGHDAKLKSLLIQAGAAGCDVRKDVDDGYLTMSAMDAANEYGFASTVEQGIAKAQDRLAAKAKREQIKADRLAAKKSQPGPAHAKVGRKVHEGVVLEDGVTFQYQVTKGDGEDAVTETKTASRFRVVTPDEVADANA